MPAAAIIVAAGRGERLRSSLPKAFVSLAGQPLLAHSIRKFLESGTVEEICVVGPPGYLDRCRSMVPDSAPLRVRVVAGGRRRQDSVRLGIEQLSETIDLVAIHDAARPLVSCEIIRATMEAARLHGAAIAAVPVSDSVKEVDGGGWIRGEQSRESLWLAQTPQCFHRDIIRQAHREALEHGVEATDDAGLVFRIGRPIRVVPGHASNLKITVPEDLRLAEVLLAIERDRHG